MPHKDLEARRAYQQRYDVKSRRHRPPRQCPVCDRTFTPYDTDTRHRCRYCSAECAAASHRTLHLGPPEPVSSKDRGCKNETLITAEAAVPAHGSAAVKTCAVCGKTFTYTLRKLYCSAECGQAKRNERKRAAYDPAKAREANAKRRDRDPEAWRAYCREQSRKWRKNHPEHTSTEACRRWRAAKREREST